MVAVAEAEEADALAVELRLGVLGAVRAARVVRAAVDGDPVGEAVAIRLAARCAGRDRDLHPLVARRGGELDGRDLVLGAVDVLEPLRVVLGELEVGALEAV